MRLGLCQIDTVQGDPRRNLGRIVEAAHEARAAGADWAVFPELALPGYLPGDLLARPGFVAALAAWEAELAARLPAGLGVLVGSIGRAGEGAGKALRNEALAIRDGRILARRAKSMLPTYDVFDEARYFRPATERRPVDLDGRLAAVTICEDLWAGQPTGLEVPDYGIDPAAELVSAGAEFVLNLSASPYSHGRPAHRTALAASVATRLGRPVALVNLVGGDDDVLFDGSSVLVDARGRVIRRLASFAEEIAVVDVDAAGSEAAATELAPIEEVRRALVMGIRDYFRKTGVERAVLGLSGGIDSAVVAVLAAEALGPDRVTAVAMPSEYSASMSEEDARALAGRLGLDYRVAPIGEAYAAMRAALGPALDGEPAGIVLENLQPRLRGTLLMGVSNATGALLLATGNKSELAVGYCTLYGDMCGALAVIADLLKTEVYELARHLNRDGEIIPLRTLERPPSAELRPDQRDTDSLPDYAVLDPIIRRFVVDRSSEDEIVAEGFEPGIVRSVLDRISANEYKRRQMPPGLRVSAKAFGVGRRKRLAAGPQRVEWPEREGERR
ncbi:MAG: NAD+ synthase [Planctomycetota bacterium]